jgi:hypothetical protein
MWCFLIFVPNSCLAQERAHDWTAYKLFYRILADIKSLVPEEIRYENGEPLSPELKQKASRTFDAFRKLEPPNRSWGNIPDDSDYTHQLYADSQSFRDMWRSWRSEDIADVLDDLYLKAHACLLNRGEAVASVSVTVHTKKSGTEVSNWRVLCMAKILRLYPSSSPTAFPRLSSPTQWNLAPGKYIMWAENPDTWQKSTEQEIPVDCNQDCDLPIP